MNQERILTVLQSPYVSEKTTLATGQYVFKVAPSATKLEIKNAVEQLFNVKVKQKGVKICNVKPNLVTFGRHPGKQSGWKKAYVTLAQGQTIELAQS